MRADFDEADSDFVCASNLVTLVDKKRGNASFLSTGWSKFRARDIESRQKTE